MTDYKIPSNTDFLDESLEFLELCKRHCSCPDNFHFVWSACKASNRRRSIYFQQPLIKAMLGGRMDKAEEVLVAGSADSGILYVLNSIVETGNPHFTAIDICATPIEEIKRYADRNSIAVNAFCCSMSEVPASTKYDIIFIHNTLCFVDLDEALKTLQHFRSILQHDGVIVCGMRYEFMPDMDEQQAADAESAFLTAMVTSTFVDHPEIIEMLKPMLTRYPKAKHARERYRYTEDKFFSLIAATGFSIVDSYEDDRTPPAILNSLPGDSRIDSKVYMLK